MSHFRFPAGDFFLGGGVSGERFASQPVITSDKAQYDNPSLLPLYQHRLE